MLRLVQSSPGTAPSAPGELWASLQRAPPSPRVEALRFGLMAVVLMLHAPGQSADVGGTTSIRVSNTGSRFTWSARVARRRSRTSHC